MRRAKRRGSLRSSSTAAASTGPASGAQPTSSTPTTIPSTLRSNLQPGMHPSLAPGVESERGLLWLSGVTLLQHGDPRSGDGDAADGGDHPKADGLAEEDGADQRADSGFEGDQDLIAPRRHALKGLELQRHGQDGIQQGNEKRACDPQRAGMRQSAFGKGEGQQHEARRPEAEGEPVMAGEGAARPFAEDDESGPAQRREPGEGQSERVEAAADLGREQPEPERRDADAQEMDEPPRG